MILWPFPTIYKHYLKSQNASSEPGLKKREEKKERMKRNNWATLIEEKRQQLRREWKVILASIGQNKVQGKLFGGQKIMHGKKKKKRKKFNPNEQEKILTRR